MQPLPRIARSLVPATFAPLIALAVLVLGARSAPAQTARPDFFVTNGVVNAAVVSGNTLYIGGEFTHVGPSTGSAVPTDGTTGQPVSGFPAVDGCVYAVIGDGAGGWYIGGSFRAIGGQPRANLAHVQSDLSVSPWNPSANNTVMGLALSGSTLYAGGFFTEMNGQPRALIAALDASTGALAAFDAAAVPVGFNSVRSIVVRAGTVYVGGSFSSMGGQSRNALAALDATTGQATSWNAQLTGGIPETTVLNLAASATTIYACGNFFGAGGQPRSYIAALEASDGLATSWNAESDDEPLALALDGDVLYVAGQFTHIGGEDRQYIAALDATTGDALAWNPGADDFISSLAVGGGAVYAGGQFAAIGGATRSRAGAVDAVTGLATAWNPGANDWVGALAVAGEVVYIGGTFRSLGGVNRNNLAAIDRTTGMATSWNPNADGEVLALVRSGSTVYVGGWFTNVGGQSRPYVAAVDATSGAPTAWNPIADSPVEAIATDGTVVYTGGTFSQVGGDIRSYVAAIDGNGQATTWNASADGPVHALVSSGSTIYAGGGFTQIGGASRNHVAALSASTGEALAWDPYADDDVYALAVDGPLVYVGGAFEGIGGESRNHIAALDATGGEATAWNPDADGRVLALAVSGTTVYAGGEFTHVGGQDRRGLAALETGTGQAGPWNPAPATSDCPVGPEASVNAIALEGVDVYVGGAFTSMGNVPRGFLAAIGDVATPADVSLVSALAEPGHVRLEWFSADGASFVATLYRKARDEDWRSLGQVAADGTGRVRFDDSSVRAGARYGYRLGVLEAGVERFVGEAWVDVPSQLALALAGALPNPAARGLAVAFTLPDAAPARLELLDVSGRRLLARDVGALGPGRHVLDLARDRVLSPGIYMIRLMRGNRTLTSRAVVL